MTRVAPDPSTLRKVPYYRIARSHLGKHRRGEVSRSAGSPRPAYDLAVADVDPLDLVVAGYDRLAPHWDTWAGLVQPDFRECFGWLEDQLDPNSTVMELGSGTGHPVAERLASRHMYVGVDASPAMVRIAQEQVPEARFLLEDMRRLSFTPQEFDAIVAFYSIIHLPRADHPAIFRDVRQWLRPGGYFVASLTSEDLAVGEEDDWLGAGPMFWSGYDADTNRLLLRQAGFQLIETNVLPQMERDQQVRFLWVVAQAP